jgi:anaerobic magnesium-protoporphyrin IX monomethyl ester cyclase
MSSASKVLLVFPRAFEPNTVPPLGISLLAACLRDAGHEVDLLDLTVEPLRRREFDQYCLVGMTLLCTNFKSGTELAKQIRRDTSSVCIVAGGPFADSCPADVLDTGVFDIVAHGEGELLLPQLVGALKSATDYGDIGGLSFYRNGKIIRTPSQPMIAGLDALPFPAYELLPMKHYLRHSVMASRGCPWDCIFCDRGPAESRRVRFLSPEHVRDWATRMVRDFGHKPIRILDSTFTANQRWAERICDLIIKQGIRISWHCQSRIDCLNPGLLKKMRDSGCTQIVAGIDSGNDEILSLSKKGLTRAEARRGAQLFLDGKGPKLHLNFVIGHPWDTLESIQETVEFADELERDFGAKCGFYMMVPFPGTELADNAPRYEIQIKKDWEKYNKLSFMGTPERLSATFDSKYLRAEDLTQIYHAIFQRKRRGRGAFVAKPSNQARPSWSSTSIQHVVRIPRVNVAS